MPGQPVPQPQPLPPPDVFPESTLLWSRNRCDNAMVGGAVRQPEHYPCGPGYPCQPEEDATYPGWRPGFTEPITLHPVRAVDRIGDNNYANREVCHHQFGGFVVGRDGWTYPVLCSESDYSHRRHRASIGAFGVFTNAGDPSGHCPRGWTCGFVTVELPLLHETTFYSVRTGCGPAEG